MIQLGKTKGPEMQTKVVDALFEAYHEKEQDISKQAVLVKAAAAAGLDADEAKAWLESGKGGAEVDAEVLSAQRRHITGVPNFTINGQHQVAGADNPSVFVAAFERVKDFERRRAGLA